MQVEIKSVSQNDHKYQGNVTKRKLIETSDGSYNVSEKNKSYSYIPVGFSGVAEIEFDEYKGKKFIKIFKAVKGNTTQTPQKPHQQENRAINGAFKKDPAGIALEIWKRKHTSYIGCLQCATNYFNSVSEKFKDDKFTFPSEIIRATNDFYDALCKKIDKQKEEEEYKLTDKQPDIKPNPQAEAVADAVNSGTDGTAVSDGKYMTDVPF